MFMSCTSAAIGEHGHGRKVLNGDSAPLRMPACCAIFRFRLGTFPLILDNAGMGALCRR
jgi:hypothetical protein